MVAVKHKKTSAKADGPDSTEVLPSDWNDTHDVITSGVSVYLGMDNGPAGPIKELPIDATGSSDHTIASKYVVGQMIAAAISALAIQVTGDMSASLAGSKAGWVLCNGQTVHKGNGESNHALFNLLWALNANTWPVYNSGTTTPNRGASAALDWDAFKECPVPDARGCTFGMVDLAAGVNTLLVNLGVKVGEQNHVLTVPELPAHTHGLIPTNGTTTPSTGGGSVQGVQSPYTGLTGSTGGDTGHNNVQPTMGVNVFIKL